jgi:hypothetical protein
VETSSERRSNDRYRYVVPIVFSFFNKDQCFEAQIRNYCDVGMGFESNIPLKKGTTICIRVKNLHPHKANTHLSYGLRSVTLANVKWCDEELHYNSRHYAIGVQYYAPGY